MAEHEIASHYLQYNLNSEHSCEDNVSIGQDLKERHQEFLSNLVFFFFFFLKLCPMCSGRPEVHLVSVGLWVDGIFSCQGDGGQQDEEKD